MLLIMTVEGSYYSIVEQMEEAIQCGRKTTTFTFHK
jgi:hypothetical protein